MCFEGRYNVFSGILSPSQGTRGCGWENLGISALQYNSFSVQQVHLPSRCITVVSERCFAHCMFYCAGQEELNHQSFRAHVCTIQCIFGQREASAVGMHEGFCLTATRIKAIFVSKLPWKVRDVCFGHRSLVLEDVT